MFASPSFDRKKFDAELQSYLTLRQKLVDEKMSMKMDIHSLLNPEQVKMMVEQYSYLLRINAK